MRSRDFLIFGMLTLLPLAYGVTPSSAEAMDEVRDKLRYRSYTYYAVRPDLRRCFSPLCGGVFVKRLNKRATRCADGSRQHECYVATVDESALGLNDQEFAELQDAIRAQQVLLRGQIEPQHYPGIGNLGRFVISEAWRAASDYTPTGTYYRVTDHGLNCITSPCLTYTEAKLNSGIQRNIAHVSLELTGATDQQIKKAYEAMTHPGGILVAGKNTTVNTPEGKALALVGSQFYMRMVDDRCRRTGCSGQLCALSPVDTTCEWQPEYACYQTASCKRQADAQCGWTETPELLECLANAASER